MAQILSSDTIIATVSLADRDFATFRFNGINSIAPIMQRIRESLGRYIGLVKIRLHNVSQGWSSQSRIILKPIENWGRGVQLSLF